MEYFFLAIILYFLMIVYFKIANYYNIIDKPNHRSAHTIPTLRGGGIAFWFAAFAYFIQNLQSNYLFFLGITAICIVSFWDDIKSLSNKIRLITHFFAITLVFYQLNLFTIFPVWAIAIAYIVFIGIINAYNFMDGINGITGLYTLVVLGSLWYVNQNVIKFEDPKFIVYPMIASLVFLYFNFRKKARCFAGDIGSISIAFLVIYLILKLILVSDNIIWILFLTVYGTDTVGTILHRLYLRENIFEAHRHHFYQVLCNDYKLQHRLVAFGYAFLQLIVSFVVILLYEKNITEIIFGVVIFIFISIYLVKFYLIKKFKQNLNKI